MPKKDTKLQKLSESIPITLEEIRGLGIKDLDKMFMEEYLEQAGQLTDTRQQAKVWHSLKDVIGIVFLRSWQAMTSELRLQISPWTKKKL